MKHITSANTSANQTSSAIFCYFLSILVLPPDILWGGHQSSGALTKILVAIKISRNIKTLPNRLLLNKMQDFPARYSGKLWNAAWLLDNHPSPRRKHCFVLKLFAVCCLLNTVSYSSSAKLILRQLFCTAGGVQAKTGAIVECRNTIVGWVLVRKIGNCQIAPEA